MDYGVSIWDECGRDGWVESGGVVPLSWVCSAVLNSLMEISEGSSLWGWVNSILGEVIF